MRHVAVIVLSPLTFLKLQIIKVANKMFHFFGDKHQTRSAPVYI